MRHALLAILAVFVLALGTPVKAQSFEDGGKALDAGDYSTAFKIWLPLAERGHPLARALIGSMYESGKGVPRNYAEAVRWYRMAAEQGQRDAQYDLGILHAKGEVVPRNLVTAHMWINLAIANGVSNGKEALSLLDEILTREQIAEAQARAEKCFNSNYRDCD